MTTHQKTALLSVFHKEGITQFAQALVVLGWNILSSSGTCRRLREAGVPVTDVAEMVGEPILGHRVVTLSREIHAGLLATSSAEDQAELDRLGIIRIDLVCVDLYPLLEEIGRPGSTPDSVLNKTDIGGPALLRSAAKGQRIVICDPADRQRVIAALLADGVEQELLIELCAKAEFTVARYAALSAHYWSNGRLPASFSGD